MSFLGALFGTDASDASNRAAADTYSKQLAATQKLSAFGDTLPAQYNQLSQAFSPYASAGGGALKQLMGGLGLGGQQAGQDFTNAYRNLPGYQGGLDTGLKAVERGANAGNMFQSGKTLKDLYRFGSNYEDQRSGDYLSRLAGLTGMGQQATGQQVGTQAAGLGGQLATRTSAYQGENAAAPTVGQGMVAGAQAEQSALQNLLGVGAYLGGSALPGLIQRGFGGGGGGASSYPSTVRWPY